MRAILPADPLAQARENLAQLDANPPADEGMRPQWRTNRRQLQQFVEHMETLEARADED